MKNFNVLQVAILSLLIVFLIGCTKDKTISPTASEEVPSEVSEEVPSEVAINPVLIESDAFTTVETGNAITPDAGAEFLELIAEQNPVSIEASKAGISVWRFCNQWRFGWYCNGGSLYCGIKYRKAVLLKNHVYGWYCKEKLVCWNNGKACAPVQYSAKVQMSRSRFSRACQEQYWQWWLDKATYSQYSNPYSWYCY